MKKIAYYCTLFILSITTALTSNAAIIEMKAPKPRFRVLALYENGGHHVAYSRAARIWLNRLAADSNFTIDYIQRPNQLTDSILNQYQLFIQLDYPPYGWGKTAELAFQHYMEQGDGGWIGFHHASLLGEFDGFALWPWFYRFMGSIRFKNYIADFASAKVIVENSSHPVMKGVPASFIIQQDEWYTYDANPRPNAQVLAHVDESTYQPDSDIKMGDHPVIWSNPQMKSRNVYIFMGHSPALFQNTAYTTLFRNAIFWAAYHH
ncbi:hypothetical protein GCM10027037_26890 [Mucilaginibacter koreensis]